MASSILSTKPIRKTSLQTESGVSSTHASLLLYAPVTDGDEAVAQENGDGEQSAAPTPTATPNIWASPSPSPTATGDAGDAQSTGVSASNPGAVPVTLGGRTLYLAPGVPTLVELPEAAGQVSAPTPIQAAVVISADTAVGRMTTTWNVGTEGISAVSGSIRTVN